MATITSTQSGDITAGATYVGGAGPSDGDTIVIEDGHTVRLEANFTQVASTIHVEDGGIFDTQNAAGSTDYNFGPCQLIGIGNPPINNLFNTYYSNYYDELYHPDTRTLTLKVLLTSADVANFEFYDRIRIKNLIYRVNKINYKPGDLSTVEFILIT